MSLQSRRLRHLENVEMKKGGRGGRALTFILFDGHAQRVTRGRSFDVITCVTRSLVPGTEPLAKNYSGVRAAPIYLLPVFMTLTFAFSTWFSSVRVKRKKIELGGKDKVSRGECFYECVCQRVEERSAAGGVTTREAEEVTWQRCDAEYVVGDVAARKAEGVIWQCHDARRREAVRVTGGVVTRRRCG